MSEASSNTEYCADVIATYQGKFIVVERLSEPLGYAWPGGRRNRGEAAKECARRELREETGLTLRVQGYVGRYDSPSRDPRGPKITDTYHGIASGMIVAEKGKTLVHLCTAEEVEANRSRFVFDHYQMFQDYQMRAT